MYVKSLYLTNWGIVAIQKLLLTHLAPIFALLLFSGFVLADVERDFKKASIAFESRQFDEAYIHLKTTLNENSGHLPSRILMGKVLALSFLYEDAIVTLYGALEAGGDPNLIIEYLANSLLVESRFKEIVVLSELQLSAPNKAILFAIQAKAFNELSDKATANTLFLSAIRLSPDNPAIADAFAKFQIQNNNLKSAKDLAEKAIGLDKSFTEAYRTLAAIYRVQGELGNSIQTLQSAKIIDPNQPFVLRDLITAYIGLNEFEQALETLNLILINSPKDPMANFMLVLLQSKLNRPNEAAATLGELNSYISYFKNENLDKEAGFLYLSGISHYASGNTELAIEDLLTYLSVQKNDIHASIILSDIYVSIGSYNSAISILEQFGKKAESELAFGSRLCRLYLLANLNHRCNGLIQKLSNKFSDDPSFISLTARTLAARGRETEALAVLKSIDEVSDSLLIDKALLAVQLSEYEEAEKHATALLRNNPDNSDYKNLLASIYLRQNKSLLAKSVLMELLEIDPKHFSARFNLSSVYANLGELKPALLVLQKLLLEQPGQYDVLLMLAKVENRLANYEQALDYLEEALELSPESKDAKLELASVYSNMNELQKALDTVNPIIKANFLDSTYLSFRADLYIRSENYYAAKNDLATLFGIYSDDASALYNLALFQERANDFDGAWKSIQRSTELHPNIYASQLEKARLALALGDLKRAKTALSSLNREYGPLANVLMLNGDLALAEKRFNSAADFYLQALKEDNEFTLVLLKAYRLAIKGFNNEAFIALLESKVASSPSAYFERHLLGDLYLEIKQYQYAKIHYGHILQNNSYDRQALVLNNFANIHIFEEDFQNAYEKALRAQQLSPDDALILDTLGWSLSKLGRYDEGLKYLKQAFAMNTAEPAVRFHLGYTLFKLNRKVEAKKEIGNLLEQFDTFEYRENAIALLTELNSTT